MTASAHPQRCSTCKKALDCNWVAKRIQDFTSHMGCASHSSVQSRDVEENAITMIERRIDIGKQYERNRVLDEIVEFIGCEDMQFKRDLILFIDQIRSNDSFRSIRTQGSREP